MCVRACMWCAGMCGFVRVYVGVNFCVCECVCAGVCV